MITIVGCGPGSLAYITPVALRAIEEAEVLIGAGRLLNLFPESSAERIPVGGQVQEVLERITRRKSKKIAVLVTGDPGLSSLAKPVIRLFGRTNCRVIPGISSVQTAFARLGLDWLGARIIDAHGQNPSQTIREIIDSGEDKIAILGGRQAVLPWLREEMRGMEEEFRLMVCEDLTLENEQIRPIQMEDLSALKVSSRSVFLVIKKGLLE
jgi:precorrin-6y C5,15-methyltransferase (decarboxylating) CbiE subunit